MKKLINNWILRLVPYLAPVPTAYVILLRLQDVLHWDWRISLIAAAVIEMIGFRSVGLVVETQQFNRTCTTTEAKLRAPIWQPLAAVTIYFVAVVGLTILLEIYAGLSLWSPVEFVVLGLTGGWLAALSNDQEERQQAREQGREQVRKQLTQAREQAKKKKELARKQDQQVAQVAPASSDKLPPQVAQVAPASDKQDQQVAQASSKQPVQDVALLAEWRDHPAASDQQVADKFGKSRQAIQQRREKLIKRGEIKMVDNRVEIVGISVSMQPARAGEQ
jgi:hypothetical protein